MNRKNRRNKVENIWLLVHGVESKAAGMEKLYAALCQNDRFPFMTSRIKIHKYYKFPFILTVFRTFQKAYRDLLYYHIGALRYKYPNLKKINIIAHSWGTFLTAEVLREYKIEFGEIIFLGSVVNANYDWDKVKNKFNRVLNIVGKKDRIVQLAGLLNVNMGVSGYKGFNNDIVQKVTNIYTNWGHLDYAFDKNIKKIIEEVLC